MAISQISIGKKPSAISLTPLAAKKVAELLADEDDSEQLVLRVAVKAGGCSGYSYDMFFDSELEDDDLVSEFDAVKVAVDPDSANLLKGSVLDYKDGLSGAGFHITNPNATKTCGCGSSFS